MNYNIYIIGSDYLNAISIYQSLIDLKADGEIIFIGGSGRNMAGKIYPGVNMRSDAGDSDKLIELLLSFEKQAKKYLFLTHEKYHQMLWEKREMLEEYNVIFHIGHGDPELIMDKPKFLQFVKENTSIPVPFAYSFDQIDKIQYPAFAKAKSSFMDDAKISLKKQVITNQKELEKYIQTASIHGVSREDIEVQELLSTEARHNVSISGWYENDFHQFFQTQKILQHPPKAGNGDVVKLMDLDPTLAGQTNDLLSKLNYHGPFEAEFVKEQNGERYKLIEINPRFWMQHGLIEQLSGHLLVARYIGVEPLRPNLKYNHWMYTVIVPIQLAKLKIKYIPYLFRKDLYKPVSFYQASKFLVKYLLQRLKR